MNTSLATSPLPRCLLRCGTILAFMFFFLATRQPVHAAPHLSMQAGPATVRFDTSQEAAAAEVLRLVPAVQVDLQKLIPWTVGFHTTFILLKEGELENMAGTGLIVAIAVPQQNLILLDLSKMARHAFVLESTMKHELCHLLLHQYIHHELLPRWLDEGVCQWASNGIAEIIMDRKASVLEEALLAGRLLPFQDLTGHFPGDERGLLLAYEQSQSMVSYMSTVYGNERLLLVLNQLRDGNPFPDAIRVALGVGTSDLEAGWQHSLKREHTWMTYVSTHIYEILFFVAALLAVAGSVRLLVRRKKQRSEEDEADAP